MRDLRTIAAACEKDLIGIGIKIGYIDSYEVNSRATGRLGQCRAVRGRNRHFRIQITSALLSESIPLDELKNTVYHELLHTCPGCMNHGEEWRRLAGIVNLAYGMNISRCASKDEESVKIMRERRIATARYKTECLGCGNICVNQRECGFTRNPERYLCAKCGGNSWKRIL